VSVSHRIILRGKNKTILVPGEARLKELQLYLLFLKNSIPFLKISILSMLSQNRDNQKVEKPNTCMFSRRRTNNRNPNSQSSKGE